MLQSGDLVFAVAPAATHTMVVVDEGEVQQAMVGHSPGPNELTTVQPLTEVMADGAWQGATFHRARKTDLAGLAEGWEDIPGRVALLARYWCTENRTLYGSMPGQEIANASRARGVRLWWTDGNNNQQAPPFGYDALFRVFKWISRAHARGFSEHRGTTCGAFAIACYQVAAVRATVTFGVEDEEARLLQILERFRGNPRYRLDHEGNETTIRLRLSTFHQLDQPTRDRNRPLLAGWARRENANRGFQAEPLMTEYEETLGRLSKQERKGWGRAPRGLPSKLWWLLMLLAYPNQWYRPTLRQVLPPPLAVDAKYTYSSSLYQAVRNDGWDVVEVQRPG